MDLTEFAIPLTSIQFYGLVFLLGSFTVASLSDQLDRKYLEARRSCGPDPGRYGVGRNREPGISGGPGKAAKAPAEK
jgi:hypothetical protein